MNIVIDSPIGQLRLVAANGALVAIDFSPFAHRTDASESSAPAPADERVLTTARTQLEEYFAGRRTAFDLPLAPQGTAFQQQVWAELQHVEHGDTVSYGDIARRLGRTPAASRAVGLANGRNPIPIIIPCHRVIGSTGALTGYAGGLERKQALLDLENPSLLNG